MYNLDTLDNYHFGYFLLPLQSENVLTLLYVPSAQFDAMPRPCVAGKEIRVYLAVSNLICWGQIEDKSWINTPPMPQYFLHAEFLPHSQL